MITYNPKDWFRLIFQFHKSDTFRILMPTMLMLGAVTAVVSFFEKTYFTGEAPSLTVFHQISGFIISLVLVFRINTAYDRWWEGRKHWGALVNNCRNLAIKLNAIVPAEDHSTRETLYALISNFPFALKEHLRGQSNSSEMIFTREMKDNDFENSKHKPGLISSRLTSLSLSISNKYAHGVNDYLILSENLNQFMDICGACERIKNTPIPYSYSLFIKKIIFLYIITMPLSFGFNIGYWSIPVVMIMFYAFASLELLSEEIEEPFGTDSNDLPTEELSELIRKNVGEILSVHGN
jgi:ion channel-forming bestrophin family protein